VGALSNIVSSDEGLKKDKDKLALFRTLATLYEGDLKANTQLTSLELDDNYHTDNSVGWRQFVNYAPIRKFIEDLLYEKADKIAKIQLTQSGGQDTKDALKVQQMVDDKRKGEDNSHIVVMFLPKRDFGLDE